MADNYFPTPNVPTNNNPGQIPKTPVLHPPTSQNNQVPALRTSLKNGVPAGAPGGIQVGTPMDAAGTFPGRESVSPPAGSPY